MLNEVRMTQLCYPKLKEFFIKLPRNGFNSKY